MIEDVSTFRSEIGILYLSDFNRKVLMKIFREKGMEFHKLVECDVFVDLWKGHPLAGASRIRREELSEYPCLSFEQGGNGSFYFAGEIFSNSEYPRTVKVDDRATMLNLMKGLGGYTLCSGILCEELNGSDYAAIPFEPEEDDGNGKMEIGYSVKKNQILSSLASLYIEEMKQYLKKGIERIW